MPKRTHLHHDALLEDLQDPRTAAYYLNAALEDSDEMLLVALRNVAEASTMAKVAKEAGISREAIYRMLCESGNPTYSSFTGILRALGLRIAFEPDIVSPSPPSAKKAPAKDFVSRKATPSTDVSVDLHDVDVSEIKDSLVSRQTEGQTEPVPRAEQLTPPGLLADVLSHYTTGGEGHGLST